MIKKKFAGQMTDFLGMNAENKDQSRGQSVVPSVPVAPVVVPEPQRGRPKSEKKATRPIKKFGRIDEETDKKLKLLFANQNLETQDVICAAILEFFGKYYKDGYLNEEGKAKVESI